MDATVVCIDQIKRSVQVELRAAWLPHGARLSAKLSGQRGWTCLLGVIAEDDGRFFLRFEEYVTAKHAERFISALCRELEDDLFVVLDGAPYLQASAVTDLVARDDPASATPPSYSPGLNPVEERWRRFQIALSNRFLDSLDELTTATNAAFDQLSVPKVSNYF